MNAVRPNEGDRVRVTYEGEVEKVIEDGFRINGLWHYLRTTQIEVIEPALQVGWHRVRVRAAATKTFARYWTGKGWSESEGWQVAASRAAWDSVEFLGGGCDE